MKKKDPKMKGLGLVQNKILLRMAKEGLVIRVIRSEYRMSESIELQDYSGDNSYETIPGRILSSFVNRGLVNFFGWMPCLAVTIDTFSIKPEVKKMMGIEQEPIAPNAGKQNL